MLGMFIKFMPWSTTKPISQFSEAEYGKPPISANYFGINHGKPYFFNDSKKEKPVKFWGNIIVFFSLYISLVGSIIYVYRLNSNGT